MPNSETDVVQSRQKQSAEAKRATLAKLRSKKRREKIVPFVINDEELSFLFRSISARDYDKMLTEHPPNLEQRANGAGYNINTFAPALLAKVVVEPEIEAAEWEDLWKSPDWNRGELMSLFGEAVEICSTGLSLGPTARG